MSSAQLWRVVCPVTAGGEKEVLNNGPIEMDKVVGLLAFGGKKNKNSQPSRLCSLLSGLKLN